MDPFMFLPMIFSVLIPMIVIFVIYAGIIGLVIWFVISFLRTQKERNQILAEISRKLDREQNLQVKGE